MFKFSGNIFFFYLKDFFYFYHVLPSSELVVVDEVEAMVGEVQEMDEHDAVEPPSAVELVGSKVEADAKDPILMVDGVVVVVISAVY